VKQPRQSGEDEKDAVITAADKTPRPQPRQVKAGNRGVNHLIFL